MHLKSMFFLTALCSLIISCSGGLNSDDSSSVEAASVILSGKVTSDSGSLGGLSVGGIEALSSEYNGVLSLSGCTVNALSIEDSTLLATTTSDSNGNYDLQGENITEGNNYKISAVCGGNSFTSVGQAVKKVPSEITDADRIATNPRSTIISAYIVKAIVEAVQEAVGSIGDPVIQQAVKRSMYDSMSSIIATIESNVNEAIDTGAMEEPTPAEATSIASAVNSANESTSAGNIDTSLTSANIEAPPTVDQAIAGARNTAGALGACHPSAGDIHSCTRSMAKIMHNKLKFNIIIEKSGSFGQSSIITNCVGSHIVDGSQTLGDEFPESSFVEGSTFSANFSDYCIVKSNFATLDRNSGYEDEGGDDGGVMFAETGNMDGVVGSEVGIISAVASSMLAGDKYNLDSLNSMIFSHQNGAGFNARLINRMYDPLGFTEYFYKDVNDSWVMTNWPMDNGQPKEPYDLDIMLPSAFDWSSATGADAGIAQILSGNNFATQAIFQSLFAGTIPSQEELSEYIDQEKVHVEHNNTGEKEIYVLTNDFPGPSSAAGPHPCYDDDPTTPCLDSTGAPLQAISVSATLSTANAAGLKSIASLDASGDDYFLRPVYSHSGFNGIISLIKVSDGRTMRDEQLKKRYIKVVLDSSECNNNGLPSVCVNGEIYNAEVDWSSCGNGSGDCPAYTASSLITNSGLVINVQDDYNHIYEMNTKFLAVGHGEVREKIQIDVNPASGDDPLFYVGVGPASGGSYNLVVYDDCTSSMCVFSGFVLMDDTGAYYTGDSDASATVSINGVNNIALYSLAHVNNGNDFDPNTGATTVQDVALNRNINNAPVANVNHRCENEPFYIDANSNGQLDCQVQSITVGSQTLQISTAASGDISFSNRYEYERWKNDPFISQNEASARQSMSVQQNLNGYHYDDPIGVNSLLSTAFNGMLDGNHTLTSLTELDALQAFSLVFMFFQNTDDKHFDNLGSTISDSYSVITPFDYADEADMLKNVNDPLGKAFTEFKLPSN